MLAFDKLNKTSVWYKQTGPKSIQPITYMSHLQKKKSEPDSTTVGTRFLNFFIFPSFPLFIFILSVFY